MKKRNFLFFLSSLLVLVAPLSSARPETKVDAAVTILTSKSTEQYINNYYQSVNLNGTGQTLASNLETLLKAERKSSFSYGSLHTSAFPYTDVDPNRPNDGYIVSFYSGTPVKGYTGMNKEHTWPDSHGGGKIDNDPHMVRPTLTSENSARGNSYFSETSSQGWDPASFNNPKYRGIASRIILYGAVIGKSQNLTLEDAGFKSGSGNGGKMGKLSDLLKWNLQYPVDQTEIIRNETLDISLNYNRNPFIDYPQLGCQIWGSTNATTTNICSSYGAAPTSITVSPTTADINLGDTISLSVTVSPSNSNQMVTWSSSDTTIASVSSGVVTAKKKGTATITATSSADSSIKGTATITVTDEPIATTGISLNQSQVYMAKNATSSLTATVSPQNATHKTVTWTSSNPLVVSVNSSGTLTAHNSGSATIIASTYDGHYDAMATVVVTETQGGGVIEGNFGYSGANNFSGPDDSLSTTALNTAFPNNPFSSIGAQSKVYYPRGGGVAIGSSNNTSGAGSLTLNLKSEYYASKVEAKFNSGDKDNPIVTIDGSSTPTRTIGTIGTAFSYPSNGTPYIATFATPTNKVVINTSIRLILVELKIYYGSIDNSGPAALSWANSFLNGTSAACDASSYDSLAAVWPTYMNTYQALDGNTILIIENSIPYAEGSAIENALARYALIVNKYGLSSYININLEESINKPVTLNISSDFTVIVVWMSVIALVGFLLISYKKKLD